MTEMASAENSTSRSVLDSPRTLIIGRHGRLARAFRHFFPRASVLGHTDIDIADAASVREAMEKIRPCIVINCAAITDVALCERDPNGTRRVNVEGVANLAAASRTADALLVHLSSDYAANPMNEYGRAKRDSEAFGGLSIRAKIYDGSHWAWQALRAGRKIQMTTCEVSNPISTTGLAALLPILLQKDFRGVVSLGSADRLSFFEIGQIWADILGAPRELVQATGPITSPYRRPADSFMSIGELVDAGIPVPSLAADAATHRDFFADYAGIS